MSFNLRTRVSDLDTWREHRLNMQNSDAQQSIPSILSSSNQFAYDVGKIHLDRGTTWWFSYFWHFLTETPIGVHERNNKQKDSDSPINK